jgi:hypothetical protein
MTIILWVMILFSQESLSGQEVLNRSIAYHDPNGVWATVGCELDFEATRPNADSRFTNIFIDNAQGDFCMTREIDHHQVARHIISNSVTYDIDGSTEYSDVDIETFQLSDDRSYTMRDYYLYLWGLPMKLKDKGTIVHDEVIYTTFNNQKVIKLKVTYDEETGSDVWYFYLDPTNYSLHGYQFFHDEAVNDGEYITLGPSLDFSGMKIPAERSWYVNKDSTYLGTDNIIKAKPLLPHH